MPRKELVKMMAGFRRFRTRYFEGDSPAFGKLSQGQAPKTLIIACSDSRVDPAIISDASPGELFVIRNVANLVPPFEDKAGYHGVSSAIEFAIVNLKVDNVIILGHQQCGGIRALMSGMSNPEPSFIQNWVGIAEPAKQNVLTKHPKADLDQLSSHCERESIKCSLQNLRTFPFVEQAIKERDLQLIGTYFDLDDGHLFELNEETGEFQELV